MRSVKNDVRPRARRTGPRPVRRAGAVIFDCDSTLTAMEGIEHIAAGNVEIERLTDAAMRGEVPLEQVYGRRLEIVRPTRADIDALGTAYLEALVPDAREVVAALRDEGIEVRVLSGGLRPAVAALADALGIPAHHVAAVDVLFDDAGAFAGFDRASPLARAGGKREVVAAWREELPGPIVLVGDGATDLEAAGVVDTFIAYAGIVERPTVTGEADVVIRSRSLASVLTIALAGEPPSDPVHRATFERGRAVLDDDPHNRTPPTRDDSR